MKATAKLSTMYGRRYDWERWFRKSRFTLVQGRDYNGRTYTMAQQVRNAAGPKRHNVRVSIEIAANDRSLTVTVWR